MVIRQFLPDDKVRVSDLRVGDLFCFTEFGTNYRVRYIENGRICYRSITPDGDLQSVAHSMGAKSQQRIMILNRTVYE